MSDYFCGVIDENKPNKDHKRKHGLCSIKVGLVGKKTPMNNSNESYFLLFPQTERHVHTLREPQFEV